SGQRRIRRKPRPASRQRDRLYPVRIRHQREMAGASQADRSPRDARGCASRSRQPRRHRALSGDGPLGGSDAPRIQRAIPAFARSPNSGLIVTLGAPTIAHRGLIITLAARHRLPAVYPARYFVTAGGLISYGPDPVDPFRRAAGYVDRVLKGERPADLP